MGKKRRAREHAGATGGGGNDAARRAAGAGPGNAAMQEALAASKQRTGEGTGEHQGFAQGQEVWVRRSVLGMAYHHAGVHIGDGKVMHVTGEPLQAMRDLVTGKPVVTVQRTTLADFADGGTPIAGPTPTSRDPLEAAIIASSREGEAWSYDPLSHNCQHFSSESVSGKANSPEGNAIKAAFEGAVDDVGAPGKTIGAGLADAGKWMKKKANKFGKSLKGLFA